MFSNSDCSYGDDHVGSAFSFGPTRVAKRNAALGRHLLHIAEAQGEAEVHPDTVADNFGWKAMTAIRGGGMRSSPIKSLSFNLIIPFGNANHISSAPARNSAGTTRATRISI